MQPPVSPDINDLVVANLRLSLPHLSDAELEGLVGEARVMGERLRALDDA